MFYFFILTSTTLITFQKYWLFINAKPTENRVFKALRA